MEDNDYSDPREMVEMVRERAEPMGEGVLHDELIEARTQAGHYRHQMMEINVMLDSIADDGELLTDPAYLAVREMQETAQELEAWLAALVAAFEKELTSVRNDE